MAEEFEVPSPHEHHLEHVTEHAHESGDNFASKIAVMTAIMATIGALFSYQAGFSESSAAVNKVPVGLAGLATMAATVRSAQAASTSPASNW